MPSPLNLTARNFIQDLFSSIADMRPKFSSAADERTIEILSHDILTGDDETSIQRLGTLILDKYEQLDEDEKRAFFQFLTNELDLDIAGTQAHLANYKEQRSAKHLKSLMTASEPRRQEYLRRLNQVAGATQVLVAMRADLLRFAREDETLRIADLDFAHLFTSWFNRGFLSLKPISWQTPANLLGKIIKYEAVHAINDWDDLRRRLQPTDRRCFAFFHPAMPDEPLVFVEVALCKGVPNSIQDVLADRDEALLVDEPDCAAFYSISNCQKGLQGISFGNSLIKQVVTDLAAEIPHLKHFVTLSPLPGFAKWLSQQAQDTDEANDEAQDEIRQIDQDAQAALTAGNTAALGDHDGALLHYAAHYLTSAKRGDGQPIDPVARFHLRNGASVHALHAQADLSENGLNNAYGVMVNYRYDLPQVAARHEHYVRTHKVEASKQISQLASANNAGKSSGKPSGKSSGFRLSQGKKS